MFRTYLGFVAFIRVLPSQVNVDIVLAFLEFLHFNNVSATQMLNHVSAIKSFSIRLSLPLDVFEHLKITTYLKAVKRTAASRIKIHNIIDIPFLYEISHKSQLTHLGQILEQFTLLPFWFPEVVKQTYGC